MNKILLRIIGICIIASLLIPVTVGLKCDLVGTNTSTDSVIVINLNKIDDDGHLVFNVSHYATKDLDNATMHIHLCGSSPFIRFNQVDIHTELFIQHLSNGQSEFFKTKDQVFKVRPIFRRPIIPFFSGEITLVFNGYIRVSAITKLLAFIRVDLFVIPYP